MRSRPDLDPIWTRSGPDLDAIWTRSGRACAPSRPCRRTSRRFSLARSAAVGSGTRWHAALDKT
eukprot:6183597-Pleurochrysis_carterae.AAC.1